MHPKIHGGLLAVRGNPKHDVCMKLFLIKLFHWNFELSCLQMEMNKFDIGNIDLVIMNLYPFADTGVMNQIDRSKGLIFGN